MNVRTPKKYTKEMEKWFEERTKRHIDLVYKYAVLIEEYNPEKFKGLGERTKKHDETKYSKAEKVPYIILSWNYKCKAEGKKFQISDKTNQEISIACFHHIKSNRHHPEFHDDKVKMGERENVDGTKMSDMDIGEMVADWMAMSEELKNSVKGWADKVVGVNFIFTDEQKKIIYELIEKV